MYQPVGQKSTVHPDSTTRVVTQVDRSWTLLDFDRVIATETTWEGLEADLLDLPGKTGASNAIVTLVSPGGETLSVGIAGSGDGDNPDLRKPLATVEFNDASQEPPYLVVVGDPSLTFEEGGVVVFRFEGQWTEILRRNCVSTDVMLSVVKHFFLTRTLWGGVIWEEG